MLNHVKMWTPEEDEFLKTVVASAERLRWGLVALRLQREFHVYGRTGKQCRERWVNYLSPNLKLDSWTREQEDRLFECHSLYGNKWSLISKELKGRPDNNIKNHFYSLLRKGIRKINKFINQHFKRSQARSVPMRFISKILMVCEISARNEQLTQEILWKCQYIRDQLIFFSREEDQSLKEPLKNARMGNLVGIIVQIQKEYLVARIASKRKSLDSSINKMLAQNIHKCQNPIVKQETETGDQKNLQIVEQLLPPALAAPQQLFVYPVLVQDPSYLSVPLYNLGYGGVSVNQNFMLFPNSYSTGF